MQLVDPIDVFSVILYQMYFSRESYLDLDQLFYAIDNPDVLIAARRLLHDGLVSCAHPAVLERLSVGLLVVEVAQDYAWRADQ